MANNFGLVGTQRFSFSNQFSTTLICVGAVPAHCNQKLPLVVILGLKGSPVPRDQSYLSSSSSSSASGRRTFWVKMSSSWARPFNVKGLRLRVSDQIGCASSSQLMVSPL